MQRYQWSEPVAMSLPLGGIRVEVVPDKDAEADPRIPKDVLEALRPGDVLMSKVGHMMYVRATTWERIKHRFPLRRS
jgi:hypothetical protein